MPTYHKKPSWLMNRGQTISGGEVTKYKSQKQSFDGISYHSKFEAQYAQELNYRVKGKEIKSWRGQVKIELNYKKQGEEWILTDESGMSLKKRGIEFQHYANYFCDFEIEHFDGSFEYVETKGLMLEPGKTKIFLCGLLYENHPTHIFTVVRDTRKFTPKWGK
jgi:hypothetical protein